MQNIALRVAAHAVLAAGIVGAAATLSGPASAAVDYKGKVVTMIIGYAPGGGTDATGRLLGEFLAKYLPGQPDIVFRNMPGGDGVTALNHFTAAVKPDGLTITMGSSTQTDPIIWRSRTSRYDPTKFEVIGGILRGATFLIVGKDAVPRLTDKSQKPVIMGAVDATRSGIIMPMWGVEFLDWNLRWVIGYPGTAELTLALQRGEIDMTSTGNAFHIRELLKGGKHTLLTQSGTLQDGKLVPRAEFPDAPLFPEMIRPKLRNDVEKRAFDYWEGINANDKWLALPPGTPKDVVDTYKAAYVKATQDPAFLERGRKISEDMIAISGDDQMRLILQIARTNDDALDFIDKMKQKQGLPVTKRVQPAVAGPMATVTATLDQVMNEGRELGFKDGGAAKTAKVSSSETEVTIGGKTEKRASLKPGMSCEISYPGDGQTAKKVACK